MELNSLLAIIIVALIIAGGTYLSIRSVVNGIVEKKNWEQRLAHHQLVTPLRLQAYERMCLFLERIMPNNLIIRNAGSATTSQELHQILLREIREEFNHNLAQQIYIGADTWEIVRNAKEEIVTLINLAARSISPDAPANELARQIMKGVMDQEDPAVFNALNVLKKEIQILF
jgi:hypothetical protein